MTIMTNHKKLMKPENILIGIVSTALILSGLCALIRILFIERDFEAILIIVFSMFMVICGGGLFFQKRWAYRWANVLLIILIWIMFLEPAEQMFRYSYEGKVRYWLLGCAYVLSLAVLNLSSVRKSIKQRNEAARLKTKESFS